MLAPRHQTSPRIALRYHRCSIHSRRQGSGEQKPALRVLPSSLKLRLISRNNMLSPEIHPFPDIALHRTIELPVRMEPIRLDAEERVMLLTAFTRALEPRGTVSVLEGELLAVSDGRVSGDGGGVFEAEVRLLAGSLLEFLELLVVEELLRMQDRGIEDDGAETFAVGARIPERERNGGREGWSVPMRAG